MEAALGAQRRQSARAHGQQQPTTEQQIAPGSAGMHDTGSGRGPRRPQQPDPRRRCVFGSERLNPLHIGEEIGLLLLHQHSPAGGLLNAAAAAVPLEFIQRTALIGPPDAIVERLKAYAAAGVTTLSIASYYDTLESRMETVRLMPELLAQAGLAEA